MAEQLGFLQEDGGSIPTSPLELFFRPIKESTLNKMVLEKHYAHREVRVKWCFGAYFQDVLMGVISFGKPVFNSQCEGVCGPEHASRVYELNRLWMDDACPKNCESRFIGWSLRQLRRMKLILLSYADTEQGHMGMIYAASNWIYTGLTKRQCSDKATPGMHPRHTRTAENAVETVLSRKHRFVYFCDPKDRALLKYEIFPYYPSIKK